MEEEKEKGLRVTTVWFMITVALFFDALQGILTPVGIGLFVPVIAYPTFLLWFWLHGINFLTAENRLTLGIGALVEFIPGIGILPAFTGTIARIALTNKLQEVIPGASIIELGLSFKTSGQKAGTIAQVKPMSRDQFEERRRKQKIELDKQTALARKEREERYQWYENKRQEQNKYIEEHGGHEKYQKDLADLEHKYIGDAVSKRKKDVADRNYEISKRYKENKASEEEYRLYEKNRQERRASGDQNNSNNKAA